MNSGRRQITSIACAFNDSRINTVVVAVITSKLRLAEAPGNVRLPRRSSGLGKASVVNVSQLMTLDRRFLTERLKVLPNGAVERVDQGMRLVLGL
jgi:mRNA interferase MazF